MGNFHFQPLTEKPVKIKAIILATTALNSDQYSKLFPKNNLQEISNTTITIDPITS